MNSTCILFSSVLLLLIGISACSPNLNRGDMTEFRTKRGYSKSEAVLICFPRLCEICGKGNNHYCCKGACESKSSCFPSMAKVELQNGKSVTMAELKIGDKVQTVSPGGRMHYSELRAFLTKVESVTSWYRSITTLTNNTIQLSSNHLIYTRRSSIEKFAPRDADKVLIGDDVLVYANDELSSEKVTKISSFAMHGAYVPLTGDGNIVVGGVLASCYASFDHDLADCAMIPMLWYPEVTMWIFGVNNGTPDYVDIAKGFGRWVLPSASLFGKSD